ncbi:MAG: GGDEF domain-containing protein [Thermodesulfovibrionaceae bacterium]
MKVLIGSSRESFIRQIKTILLDEVDSIESFMLNRDYIDSVYKINPDIMFLDATLDKKTELWKILNTIARAPSTREIPVIIFLEKKTAFAMKKICELEIFDYIVEPFLKCEVLIKVNKAKQIIELKKEFSKLLTRDPLTGAYNRAFLFERLNEELNWCSLYKEPLTVAMFDIDFFNKINDTYGHLTGDRVLTELVHKAISFLPDRVLVGRYGGEEFCILMPSTNEEEAKEILEGFRKSIENSEFLTFKGDSLKLTISIGFTTFYGENHILPDEIIQKADIALYRAKQEGRNRVIFESFIVE